MLKRIMILPGDGIGPEVTNEAVKVLKAAGKSAGMEFKINEALIGGASIESNGVPITDDTIQLCRRADAVFLGAVGGPQWDHLPKEQKPETGLLRLRRAMESYINLRPVVVFPSLIHSSTLKPDVVMDIDILVVRELTGGIYFGEPRYIEPMQNGEHAVDTMAYATHEIERIAQMAFNFAQNRRNKVISVDKANVLMTSQLWRKTVSRVAQDYRDVSLEHMLVDNCAMQLIRNPKQFDVILTANMFGDILSDEASMLSGSLGMLSSASLGEGPGLYEPAHGSAPDIAGKGVANPLASIGSIALLFRYSFKQEDAARRIEQAITKALNRGYRTADLYTEGTQRVGTAEMGNLVVDFLS